MNGFSKKKWAVLSILIVIAMLLVSCGQSGPNAAEAPVSTDATTNSDVTNTPESTEKILLSVWGFEGDPDFFPLVEAAYEEQNPNIDVVFSEFPEDEFSTKIDTAWAAGQPPDLSYILQSKYLKLGALLPVGEYLKEKGVDLSTFNQGAMTTSFCNYEGEVYCAGSFTGALFLIYNKDMFDAAGVDYPSSTVPMTHEEYAALASKLTVPSDDLTQYVWGGFAPAPYWWHDPSMVYGDGGRSVSSLTSPETIQMFETLAGMVESGDAPSQSNTEGIGLSGGINAAGGDLFVQKRVAMSIVETAHFPLLVEAGINWGAAPLPVSPSKPALSVAWTDGLFVWKDAQHPQEALEFMYFLATEGNRIRVTELDTIPCDLALAKEYDWVKGDPARQQVLDVLSVGEPISLNFSGMWDGYYLLDDPYLDIIEGQMSAAESLQAVSPDIQAVIDQAWADWDNIK